MSISLMLGVSYLLVFPVVSLVIYSACVVSSRASEAAAMRAAKINRMQNPRLARIQYNSQSAWRQQSLRS